MISLITGLPGHGKGLYSLTVVDKLQRDSGRPVYYHNIKDLSLKWHELKDPKEWFNLPEGSIIVLDEAWQTFPLRPNSQIPPAYIAELATHRHKGFDIFIITQQPSQLDTFIRKLVDKHFHVVRIFGSEKANVHEFVGLNTDPQRSRKNSIKHTFKFPKEVYNWYKSAEVHTVKTKRPFRIYMLWFGLPLICALGVFGATKILNPKGGAISDGIQTQIHGDIKKNPNLATLKSTDNQKQNEKKELNYIQSHIPLIEDFPHTAPAYAEITKPVNVPYPAACVSMGNLCKCYTTQGTKLNTSDAVCQQIVANGFFVEWQDNLQQSPTINEKLPSEKIYPARDDGRDFTNSTGMSSRTSPSGTPLS